MSWTFVYLMVGLKIPIFALLYIVWWAIHATPETEGTGDGGISRPRHPRPSRPRRRPRGPHGGSDSALASPPRVRHAAGPLPGAARPRELRRRWRLLGRRPAVARLGRVDLALVVAAEVAMPVRPLRRRVEPHERQLRDRLARVELDRHARQVRDLERQGPREPRIDEAGGGVHDEPQATQRALALDPGDDVIRDHHVLERAPQHELPGVDDERPVVVDLDALGEIARRVVEVDRRRAVVVKDAERGPEPQVDRGGLDELRIPRLDRDVPLLDEPDDRPVGEDRSGALHAVKLSVNAAV